MKKTTTWVAIIVFIIFVIDWGIVGLKLFGGDYNIIAGAYAGIVCFMVMFVCTVYKVFSNKCPHC